MMITCPNKRHTGLDALLTKLLHKHNFHKFGRDLPQDASHKIGIQTAQDFQKI